MSLLTLFSAPKPFTDPATSLSQQNAIRSWSKLPGVDVLLLGEEEGLGQAAREIGVRHVGDVRKNPNGVPLISSMLQCARESSASPLLGIVNADVVLMPDFVEVARTTMRLLGAKTGRLPGFLLVSRRWDLDVRLPLDFSGDWDTKLRTLAHQAGSLHRPTGSDVFVFPPQCYADMPDFAIGRAGWDNWMIYKARKEGWRVIDCTPSACVVHQNHDYRHLPGARPHYNHPDTHVNTALAGGVAATRYTLLDCTDVLVDGKLIPPRLTSARFLRGVELSLRRTFSFLPADLIEDVARPKRWGKRLRRLLGKSG